MHLFKESGFTALFGINIAVGKREELLLKCVELIGKGGAISTVNPEILYDSLRNPDLHLALCESLCIPDGAGVENAIRRQGVFCERLPGVELGEEMLEKKVATLGIIGGKEGVAKAAMERLVMRHKNVIPEFAVSGYDIDCSAFEKMLSEKRPDIVFVCLGSPKQELFIKRMRCVSKKTLFVALGGSVDVYSGKKQRAPKFLRSLNCEWIYRMIREPERIKRLPKLFGFMFNIVKKEKFRVKIGKKTQKTL